MLKPGASAHLCYHGVGYYLRYLLCASSLKLRFYGLRTLVNTWFYIVTERRVPGFLGDTLFQSRRRLARYYRQSGLSLQKESPSPSFLGCPVFIYHSVRKMRVYGVTVATTPSTVADRAGESASSIPEKILKASLSVGSRE